MAEVAGGEAALARAGDAPDLATVIEGVLREPGDAPRARAVRARAELFTWDASFARHVEAYERAARG